MLMPRSAASSAVGPTGNRRPGPPGRSSWRGTILAAVALFTLASFGLAGVKQPSGTHALFTSQPPTQVHTLQGGTWAAEPPAACRPGWHERHGWHWFMEWQLPNWDLGKGPRGRDGHGNEHPIGGQQPGLPTGPVPFHGNPWPDLETIYGTMADDEINGGNWPQIVMGLAGNDTLNGGNSLDCLVGGPGDDILKGSNSTDVLIGGLGFDKLHGGNGFDILVGDADADDLDGGRGPDIILAGPGDTVARARGFWPDIVIRLDELDNCDASGSVAVALDCLLPDSLSKEDAAVLSLFANVGNNALFQTEDESRQAKSLTVEPETEDGARIQERGFEEPETAMPTEHSESVNLDDRTTGDDEVPENSDAPPTRDPEPQVLDPAPPATDATTAQDAVVPEGPASCESSDATEENCEMTP